MSPENKSEGQMGSDMDGELDSQRILLEGGQKWDWIIVGTGVGGSTFGHALARAGCRVLFIEKGADSRLNKRKLAGDFLETLVADPAARSTADYANAGRSALKIWDKHRRRWIMPILGSGTGGSSALYGMVMERFWQEDFEPRRWHPHTTSSLPDRWPISFDELLPYYEEAERLYSVSSLKTDPLRTGQSFAHVKRPPLSLDGMRRMADLQERGLHPYTLPLARTWGTPCQFCQSFLCAFHCKNDAAKICLNPALRTGGASLLTGAEVIEITSADRKVTGVQVKIDGRVHGLSGDHVAVAAGALMTPLLLLKSRSPFWPEGLANGSGLVGRNLMRHYIDLVAVPARAADAVDQKEIGLNDFYLHQGRKYGTLADFGRMPPLSAVMEDLDNDMAANVFSRIVWPLGRPLLAGWLNRLFKRTRFMALILEDLPYPDNRVVAGTGEADITIHYSIHKEEQDRIRQARRLVRGALSTLSPIFLTNASNTKLLAHACGTCRMGDDPAISVVDRFNRAHGLENLYIMDGSFFPSSGGANPALTIAANALRAAAHWLAGPHNKEP